MIQIRVCATAANLSTAIGAGIPNRNLSRPNESHSSRQEQGRGKEVRMRLRGRGEALWRFQWTKVCEDSKRLFARTERYHSHLELACHLLRLDSWSRAHGWHLRNRFLDEGLLIGRQLRAGTEKAS